MRSSAAVYGLTLGAVLVAFGGRWLLDPLLGARVPSSLFLLAVVFASWLKGWRPALLATLLGFLLSLYFFVPYRFSFLLESRADLVSLALYLVVCLAIAGFGEAMWVAQSHAALVEVTAPKATEQALREADRRKDEFLATLAHELRNPLNPIRSSLEIMKRAKGDSRLIEEARRTMERQGTHLVRLIDDLLDVSRIQSDKLVPHPARVEPAKALAPALPESETVPSAARRILVVDDNTDSALSVSLLLEMAGHETRTAYDGLEAVEVAGAYKPEVVLLDIGLPWMSGYDVCRAIRDQPWGRDILIVALSGWGQEEDRRKSQEAGFNRHLVKPLDYPVLEKLLEAWPAV